MLQFTHLITSLAIKSDHIFMELEQCLPMRYCKQSNLQFLGTIIKLGFYINTHCTCALVQYSKKRLMVEKSSHCHSLFLASGQYIIPVIN